MPNFPSHDAGARPKRPPAPPLVQGPWQVAPSGPPPSGPGAPGAQGAPGAGGFDYASNPYYQQALAAINASGAADAANTRAAIQSALVSFGFVPGGFKDKLGALDATTKALIDKNTQTGISGYARLLEGRTEGIKGLVSRLQSRGLRRSGAKGYGLRKNQLGHDRNMADAISQLLGGINGQYGQYAQNEYARQMQQADAMRYVFDNYYTAPGESRSSGGDTWYSGGYTPTGGRITDYSNPSEIFYDAGGGLGRM